MAAFHTVIPARFGSTRLPGKALLPLAGKPMLQWVHERACAAGGPVWIATDDEHIAVVARAFGDGVPVLMTEKDAVKCRGIPADGLAYLEVSARIGAEDGRRLVDRIAALAARP